MTQSRPQITEPELRIVDRVLGSASGYVLDFSNRTFAHFFDDFGVDIDADRFLADGTSKANRLRTFLRTTPPPLTGQVLQSLLERRLERRPADLSDADVAHYRALVARLTASPPPKTPLPTASAFSPPTPVARAKNTEDSPLPPKTLRSRLTDGEHPKFDLHDSPWNGPLPDIEPGVPEVLHDVVAAGVDVLLMTAVQVERDAVLRIMKPSLGRARIAQAPFGHLTYYVGLIGDARVVLTMSRPGAVGRDAALLSLYEAMQHCEPRAVIAVGIAFGGYTEKLKIGDVLFANRVIAYEPARKQAGGDRARGPQTEPGPLLLNRFRNVVGWRFERPDGLLCAIAEGPLLSGEKLVDDLDFKEELFTEFPESIGGEMEGAGIAATSEKLKVEWIIVKAVCDWGDGTKGKTYQPLAAAAAASLVAHVVSAQASLADLPRRARAPARTRVEVTPRGILSTQPSHHSGPHLLEAEVQRRDVAVPEGYQIPPHCSAERAFTTASEVADADEMYNELASRPVPRHGVIIACHETRWAWDLFPTLLEWSMEGVAIRVYHWARAASDDIEQRQESWRMSMLKQLGVELVDTSRPDLTGFLLDVDSIDHAHAIVLTQRRDDFTPLARIHTGRASQLAIRALRQRLDPTIRPLAEPSSRPVLTRASPDAMYAALRKGVTQYNGAGTSFSLELLDIAEVSPIVRRVREFKLRQVHRLIDRYRAAGLQPFEPAAVRMGSFSSPVLPPVVERSSRGMVLIEGNTRAAYCYWNGIKSLWAIVVTGVTEPLPGEPGTLASLCTSSGVAPPSARIVNWDRNRFRTVERAMRPY